MLYDNTEKVEKAQKWLRAGKKEPGKSESPSIEKPVEEKTISVGEKEENGI